MTGVTREALRQRFIKELGVDRFKSITEMRREKRLLDRKARTARVCNGLEEALLCLKDVFSGDPLAAFVAYILRQPVFENARRIDLRKLGVIWVEFAQGVTVGIRIAVVDPNSRDFSTGYLRFNVRGVGRYSSVVFGIVKDGEMIVYVLGSHELEGLKSLALRFKDRTGGKKYGPAIDCWGKISEAVRL